MEVILFARNHNLDIERIASMDNVFNLTYRLQLNPRLCNRKIFPAFVDLCRPFDSIDHKLFWLKLNKFGVSSTFIRIIKHIYDDATSVTKQNSFSTKFPISGGVILVESLRPLLFPILFSRLKIIFIAVSGSFQVLKINIKEELTEMNDDERIYAKN